METVYDIECPRCGAQPSEPCWDLQVVGRPNEWPHIERDRAAKKGPASSREGTAGIFASQSISVPAPASPS